MKNKLNEYKRVFRVTKKPTREKYKTIVKASGIGIVIIGLIGFLLTITKQVILG